MCDDIVRPIEEHVLDVAKIPKTWHMCEYKAVLYTYLSQLFVRVNFGFFNRTWEKATSSVWNVDYGNS